MSDIAQQDIAYQPTTKAYSLPPNQVVPSNPEPELEPKPKGKPNVFVLLILEILGLLVVFTVFLLVLNYFRIISLSNFTPNRLINLPQLTQSSTPSYDPQAGIWSIKGVFYQYNDEKIKVRTGFFKIMDFVYKTDSLFLKSSLPINNTQQSAFQAGTLFDLDQKENLGKNVSVDYKIENNINYVNTITLYK
jgi:hypothetical protein